MQIGLVIFYTLCKNVLISKARSHLQYPLSENEHAAMSRYLAGMRKQLQDVCDLFSTRYGRNSSIAEIAVKTLVSATLLEHELMLLEDGRESAEAPETLRSVAAQARR